MDRPVFKTLNDIVDIFSLSDICEWDNLVESLASPPAFSGFYTPLRSALKSFGTK